MPDPNAHADTLKVPDEYTPPTIKDALPPMWWFCPWPVVTALADTVDHLKSTSRGEQAARIAAERKADEEVAKLLVKCDDYARALAEARRLATDYRRQLDDATSQLHTAKDHVAMLDARMHQEQLDHAATLGYVRKVEAQLKRLKAKGKLLFEDKVGGNSIYAPKPKAKKKGGRK